MNSAVIPGLAGGAAAGALGSYMVHKNLDGSEYIKKDGQKYPVRTIGQNKFTNIDGKDYAVLNDDIYEVK